MYRIDIYYNKKGELTLSQHDEEEHLVGRCHERNVQKCLSSIKDEEIKKVFASSPDTATVVYDEDYIQIHNIHKMENEPLMQDYFKILEKAIERQQEERATTVTRKNKHTGLVALAATALIITIASTLMMGAGYPPDKAEATTITKTPGIYQEGEMPSQTIKTDVTTFETPATEEIPITEETIPEENYAFLEYSDRSDSEKLHTAADLYWDTIEKYANMYGLDPELVLALATQERGIHSSKRDPGGATGLMQIQNAIWLDEKITAYNFETQSYETFKVTKERIENCETNIKIGCMILQDMISDKNYNILAGLLSYNMGGYNVNKILNKYSEATGLSRSEILADQTNCGWHEYRDIITVGDRNYLPHVLSYMGNDIDTYVIKPNGERIDVSIKNYDASKTASR